jgi:hypothetical protein
MSDKKISELTELTAPDGTEELVVNDSGTSKKITQANLFKLGDNVKANFGAGDDLQIYHTGSVSVIADEGTGNLLIRASDLRIQNSAGSGNYLKAVDGAEVEIMHNGSTKLATTATGVDVTGSATATSYIKTEYQAGFAIGSASGVPRVQTDSTGNMRFFTAGDAETVRFPSTGGITFNGDTAAANALDDYETGTWTPVFQPTTGAFDTLTMDTIASTYTKVGNLVTIGAYIRTDAVVLGTASGSLLLGGLPFTVSGYGNAMAVGHLGAWGGAAPSFGYGQTATSYINLRYTTSLSPTGSSAVPVSSLGTGANNNQFVVLLSYRT